MSTDYIPYMGHHWIQQQGDQILIGLTEDALNEIDSIESINFPNDGEEVSADEPCGEINTSDGHLNIYSPVNGTVTEINPDVRENPSIIFEDPYEEGWLLKIQSNDEGNIEDLLNKGLED